MRYYGKGSENANRIQPRDFFSVSHREPPNQTQKYLNTGCLPKRLANHSDSDSVNKTVGTNISGSLIISVQSNPVNR